MDNYIKKKCKKRKQNEKCCLYLKFVFFINNCQAVLILAISFKISYFWRGFYNDEAGLQHNFVTFYYENFL